MKKTNNLHLIVSALSIAFMSGCAIEPKQFVGPNGKTAYSMKCSGMGRDLDACYQKAGQLCKNGYIVVDRSSSVKGSSYQGSMYIGTNEGLAIECK